MIFFQTSKRMTGFYYQKTCITKNVKGISLGRRYKKPVRILELYKGMKSAGYDKNEHKYEVYFF